MKSVIEKRNILDKSVAVVAGMIARILCYVFYRIGVKGEESFPKEGGVLVIANHVSYLDAVLIWLTCPRKVRVMGKRQLLDHLPTRLLFRAFGVIPVEPTQARSAVSQAIKYLKAGEVVLIFPEGKITLTGKINPFQRGFELIARQAQVPVVPVAIGNLWGSIFSFYGERFFWKMPKKIPYPVQIHYGNPLSQKEDLIMEARKTILDLGVDNFSKREDVNEHLGRACIRSLMSKLNKVVLIDRTMDRKELKGGQVLAMSIALAKKWKKTIPGKRVGIVLPPGAGGTIVNLAVLFAGKVPVNMNFTAGRASIEASLKTAEISTIITAGPVKKKIPDFPWLEDTRDVMGEMKEISKFSLVKLLISFRVTSAKRLADKLGLPEHGGDTEAALLFSSGSTGEPKGVVLTHRNILGNVRQVEDCGVMPENETLLGYLPIFHSFGFTVTIWFPLISGVRLVTLPSPLEVKRIGEVVREEQVTVLLGTPTFYRPYFTKVKKEDLQSLKFVIAGAEKTPEGFAQKWEETFGSRYLEGYGLTETSPVVSVNLPHEIDRDGRKVEGRRTGSVGPLFPGLSARILHPETLEELPLNEQGILALRGPNIFPGYLRDEARTEEMFRDGWLVTGDLARFDDEGFLYIEGRLSRFSKIAGEMVPHGTVETYIAQTFGWMEADKPQVAVASVKDEAKGEALVVFSIREIDASELRNRLIEAGLPNLWVPRIIKVVEEIPTLATGKLDLKALRQMAESL